MVLRGPEVYMEIAKPESLRFGEPSFTVHGGIFGHDTSEY